MPAGRGPGDEVIGATLNTTGSFHFRATKVGKDTALAQIVKLVKEAQLYAIQHYTSYYNIATPIARQLLDARIRNFEVEASNTAMHRADMWFEEA